ncbi:MAG: hypothetical protein ACKPKO_43160, partial [Candidatus Fonsibacter sp.]
MCDQLRRTSICVFFAIQCLSAQSEQKYENQLVSGAIDFGVGVFLTYCVTLVSLYIYLYYVACGVYVRCLEY